MPSSSILAVGDELLAGFTLDTNSHWLAERLRLLGHPLKRMTIVHDRQADIVEALRRAIELRPEASRWARGDEDLAALRGNAEFEALVER